MTADTCFQAPGAAPDIPVLPARGFASGLRQGEQFPLDPAAKDFLQTVRKKDTMVFHGVLSVSKKEKLQAAEERDLFRDGVTEAPGRILSKAAPGGKAYQ